MPILPHARGLPLVLCATLALALGGASVLATCPPEQPGACSEAELSPDVMVPPAAHPVLTMQAEGVWKYNCTGDSPSTAQYSRQDSMREQGGSYANLTGGGFEGEFYYEPSGWDAVVLLWRQGSSLTDSADRGALDMPLAEAIPFDSGTTRADVRFAVKGCSVPGSVPGRADSEQDGLPLPPIYFAVKSNYTEPTSEAPPPSEEDRRLPASCDPSDPKQATLAFPWKGTFTFYTC